VPLPDADAALARLMPRLDEGAAPPPGTRVPDAPGVPGALQALMAWLGRIPALPAALALGLAVLAVSLPAERIPAYRALGPVPEAGGDTTVVFRPDTAAADVRRILAATGAGAVRGPTVAGAYVLDIGAGAARRCAGAAARRSRRADGRTARRAGAALNPSEGPPAASPGAVHAVPWRRGPAGR
jgi:hypothetical protein